MKNKKMKYNGQGFTLIELLVVIAIIALLSSVALIATMSARQKSRDARRLSDMTQMNTALELYFATNKGYPSSTTGFPSALVPNFTSSLPSAPLPPDGTCGTDSYPISGGILANRYYYYPTGTSYPAPDGSTVYADYGYFFCLGDKTGNFAPGKHLLTPTGLK